jgi:RNA polymerase sigma-70 factor (ECF subfamily)
LWDTVDEASPERLLIGRENLSAVRAALDALPERTRRIFLMNRIEQISHRRIAEMLGISDEAVYYHIRRALERLAVLRDELAD